MGPVAFPLCTAAGPRAARSLVESERAELVGAMLVRERPYHVVAIALDDVVALVEREIDPMVREPTLRKVVGADPLGTIARADEAAPLLRRLGLALRDLGVAQPRRQPRHGARPA